MPRRFTLLLALAAVTACTPVLGQESGVPLPFPEKLRPKPQPPLPEGFALQQVLPVSPAGSQGSINLPREVPARLARCWNVPGSQSGKRLSATVRLSFRVDGSVLGTPSFTFVDAPPGSALRADVTRSISDAIKACTPLPFTAALGSAIAGRPITIHFVANPTPDTRETPI